MAIWDLAQELERAADAQFDSATQRRICDAVLARLETKEKSNDVQAIAVKCLSVLMKRVQEAQVIDVADKLCAKILKGTAELRDIYSIGLKGLINDIQPGMGPHLTAAVSPAPAGRNGRRRRRDAGGLPGRHDGAAEALRPRL